MKNNVDGASPTTGEQRREFRRRDFFAGALGITAMAAGLDLSRRALRSRQVAAEINEASLPDERRDLANSLAVRLGILRGALAHSAQEKGSC